MSPDSAAYHNVSRESLPRRLLLSRLTDDQSQARICQEAEAVERVIARVRQGAVEIISSEALEDEVGRNPSMERRVGAETLLSLAAARIEIDDGVAQRATALVGFGFAPYDALHIAAAEAARVDVMLTTDDKVLKRAARKLGDPRIPVQNPVSWIKKQGL